MAAEGLPPPVTRSRGESGGSSMGSKCRLPATTYPNRKTPPRSRHPVKQPLGEPSTPSAELTSAFAVQVRRRSGRHGTTRVVRQHPRCAILGRRSGTGFGQRHGHAGVDRGRFS